MELYRKVATSIPSDVEDALKAAFEAEEEGNSKDALSYILQNIRLARKTARPICQDTGTPTFYVTLPRGIGHDTIIDTIIEATRLATQKVPLRPNAVDIITDKNSGDNTGIGIPIIYIEDSPDSSLIVDLMLKGSGCENTGMTYRLPLEEIGAERDLEGVRRCVLDTVHKAQGRGCPPYTIGVGIGAAKDQVTRLAKTQLLRKLTDKHPNEAIAGLEQRLTKELNTLGIGSIGFGGKTTALGVKIGFNHRHPASYFVDISVSCWANRRGRLIW